MSSISEKDFLLFREYIEKICGVHLEPEKMYLIESRLASLMVENGFENFYDFYKKISQNNNISLKEKIIDAITTHETLWFRDSSPFVILGEILKKYSDEIKSQKRSKIHIWCAACSTGQEPYSVAITILEEYRKGSGLSPDKTEILATDISPTALFMAQNGKYDALSVSRGLPLELREKYFEIKGKIWSIKDEVKKMVTFKKQNLMEDFSWLGKFDIVFCRNVLIYFTDPLKKDILTKIAKLLRPEGYLFVGSSESISLYSNEYKMIKHSIGLYYQVI